MALTDTQSQALATALRNETDPGVVAALAIRDDVTLVAWCNSSSAVDAWNPLLSARDLFEAMDVTKYDALTAGKRDAYRQLQDFAPQDAGRNKVRKAIDDVWGATDSPSVLAACQRKATRAEVYITPNIVANQATTRGVTGLKLNWVGPISITEMSQALNRF